MVATQQKFPEEMTQSLKCLLSKHEDLSFLLSIHTKKAGSNALWSHDRGSTARNIPVACSLVELVNSGLSEKSCLRQQGEE